MAPPRAEASSSVASACNDTGIVLPREFYARPTLEVARDLIGKVLVHVTPAGVAAGAIVEAEAYIGEADAACHAAPGRTRRNQPLYGEPGFAYVYLNYGIHYLVNAVTEPKGSPAAVLIRALQPVQGVALMRRRRARSANRPAADFQDHELCRGPGNLTRALGISLAHNTLDLTGSRLFIEDRGLQAGRLAWSRRIGIRVAVEREWRCYVAGHAAVSGTRT
jgi:DNA-3-methyladenine glycosylase